MATLWDEIKKALKDGYITAAGKTEELTRIGRIKLDIVTVKRKIDKRFSELGGRVYHLLSGTDSPDVPGDQSVQRIREEIKTLEAELQEKEQRIEAIREEEREKVNTKKQTP